MYKMTLVSRLNFFEYFPVDRNVKRWGLYASGLGFSRVSPQVAYPLAGHPEGHSFLWEKGRVIQEYQIIYIQQGTGVFESEGIPQRMVKEGELFLLFPGVWHRYRPDRSTGWTEYWMEVKGSYLDHLRQSKLIRPEHPIHSLSAPALVEELFEESVELLRLKPYHFSLRMGSLGLQILSLLNENRAQVKSLGRPIEGKISAAQSLLAKNVEKNIQVEELARELGVGYSYFRREFKKQTGFSLKQYQIELRIRRVKGLLQNSSLSIKEISERLGYYSPYHLSVEFTKHVKSSPKKWREG